MLQQSCVEYEEPLFPAVAAGSCFEGIPAIAQRWCSDTSEVRLLPVHAADYFHGGGSAGIGQQCCVDNEALLFPVAFWFEGFPVIEIPLLLLLVCSVDPSEENQDEGFGTH